MKKILFFLLIFAAFIIFMNFDRSIEIVNDLRYPTLDISVENFSLKEDGVLALDVKLENVTENPISVGTLEIMYVVVLDNKNYEETERNFIVKKTIEPKDQLIVFVMLSDYYNLESEDEAPAWIRQKKNRFGLKITVKKNSGETIKQAKRKVNIST